MSRRKKNLAVEDVSTDSTTQTTNEPPVYKNNIDEDFEIIDCFAMFASIPLIMQAKRNEHEIPINYDHIALESYKLAQAMLKAKDYESFKKVF